MWAPVERWPRTRSTGVALLLFGASACMSNETDEGGFARAHERLLDIVAGDFRATADATGLLDFDPRVRKAMRAVPRHEFVDPRERAAAYANHPLSIGHGQTISQPFIVALMSQLAALSPGARVLEIGTGSGYQAAVLAELGATVFSIEIIAPLAERARNTLARLGYGQVEVRVGDGNAGWPEAAPFAAILVTAGGRLPLALLEQLAPDGRIVIPIESEDGMQTLTVVTLDDDGEAVFTPVLPVRFVPLVDG